MLRLTFCLLVLGCAALPALAADDAAEAEVPADVVRPHAEPAAAGEIAGLIESLDSRSASVRSAAAARLAATGKPAIEALQKAGRSASLETRVRAVTILREIYVNGEIEDADAAETALGQLVADAGASVASRAGQVLSSNSDLSQKRALREITRLGGIVNYQENAFGDGNTRMLSHIVLGKDWSGGDEGLRFVKRLQSLRVLYHTPDAKVTETALQDVATSVPNLEVQRRGRACLGVKCSRVGDDGCFVSEVVEGTAAHKARFQMGDTITAFSGMPVANFDELIKHIGNSSPGDKVKIQVRRNGQLVTLDAVMDEWK